jgi:hypothetical protein
MLGRAAGRHGSCCGGPPGPDCADYYKGKKAQRAHEKREWQKEERVPWRTVRKMSLNLTGPEASELAKVIAVHNHAVEAVLEGSWLVFRIQEKENGEVHEYAVPYTAVHFISYYPQEG